MPALLLPSARECGLAAIEIVCLCLRRFVTAAAFLFQHLENIDLAVRDALLLQLRGKTVLDFGPACNEGCVDCATSIDALSMIERTIMRPTYCLND